MTCDIDDDAHHWTECSRCDGSKFRTPECRPEPCPICAALGHVSAYLRVIRREGA